MDYRPETVRRSSRHRILVASQTANVSDDDDDDDDDDDIT